MLALAIEFIRVHLMARNSLSRFGGYSGGETPGPIPNPEVKPSRADGTALVTGWESRSPPRHIGRGPRPRWPRGLSLLRVRFHRWQIGIGKAVSRRPPDAGAGPSPAAAEEEIASERTLLENRWAAPIAEVRPRIVEVRQGTGERPGQGAPPPLLRVRSSNRSVPFPSRD